MDKQDLIIEQNTMEESLLNIHISVSRRYACNVIRYLLVEVTILNIHLSVCHRYACNVSSVKWSHPGHFLKSQGKL